MIIVFQSKHLVNVATKFCLQDLNFILEFFYSFYPFKCFDVVKKLGQVLMYQTKGNGCRLFLVGIHILAVLVKSPEISRKVIELFDSFLFFFAAFDSFAQVFFYQFLSVYSFVGFLFCELLCDLFSEAFFGFFKVVFFLFVSISCGI